MTVPVRTPDRRRRSGSARRQAKRAVAQLHHLEVLELEALIEKGADIGPIVRARRDHIFAEQVAAENLARLRGMVVERLARQAAGHEPWPGPLLMPRGVDFGQVDMYLYVWAAVLLGVVLAQNAVDGNPAAAGRPFPDQFTLWDFRLPEFWHGEADDDGEQPGPVGKWPQIVSSAQARREVGAA